MSFSTFFFLFFLYGVVELDHIDERYFDFAYESIHLFVVEMVFPVSYSSLSHERLVLLDDAEIVEPRVIGSVRLLHHVKSTKVPEVG